MSLGPFAPIPPREKIRRSHINDLRTALTGIQDAYDVAVANGFVGTRGQWLDSLKGEKGDPGAGLAPIGSVETVDDLPDSGNTVGDVRTVDADGRAYRWDGSAWIDVGLFRGPGGEDTELRSRVDPGEAGVTGQTATGLRWSDGAPIVGKFKEAFLNDFSDIDPTGTDDMGVTINTYFEELRQRAYTHVYSDGDTAYKTTATITVPNMMTWQGAGWKNQKDGTTDAEHHRTIIQGDDDNLTVVKLGKYSRALGLNIDLGNHTGSVGLEPGDHNEIGGCLFGHVPVGSWGIRGGGIVYLHLHDCMFSDVHPGVAIELKQEHSPHDGATYYGVNVAQIERNRVFAPGGVELEGFYVFEDNNLEGAFTAPALRAPRPSGSTQLGRILYNYIEHSGGLNQSMLLGDQFAGMVEGNEMYGQAGPVEGSYGVKFAGPWFNATSLGANRYVRFETGVVAGLPQGGNGRSSIWTGSEFVNVTTPVSGLSSRASASSVRHPVYWAQDGKGHNFLYGAQVGHVVRYRDDDGNTIDLTKGSIFHLDYSSPVTLNRTGHTYGMRFTLYFHSGNVTISNSAWNTSSGENETPEAGKSKDFFVDYNGVIREVNP